MRVVIPDILTGGTGRAIQGVGQAIGNLGASATQMGGRIADAYEKEAKNVQDQQDYVEGSRLENDMLVEKNKGFAELTRTQDGTNSKYMDEVRTFDDKIGNDYIGKATSPRVADYLTKVHMQSQKSILLKAQGEQDIRLFRTTIEANKIKSDNIVRATVQYGGYDQGLATVGEVIESQSGFLGPLTEQHKRDEQQRFTYNFVRTSLSDPQLSVTMLRRLEDQKEKEKIYSHLPADKLAAMETHIKTAYEFQESLGRDRKAQENEARRAAKESLEAAQESTRQTFVGFYADGKLRESTILQSNLDAKEKKVWIDEVRQQRKAVSSVGDTAVKTDKVLEAALYTRIVQDAENVSDTDILRHAGSKLTKDDAKQLIDERRRILTGETDPARHEASKAIMEALKRDRNHGVLGEGQSGDMEYSKQVQSFRRWLKANPDKEPQEYYEKVMEPKKISTVMGILDYIPLVNPDRNPDPAGKRQAMEQAGEIPKGNKKPTKPMTELPPAAAHEGRKVRDTETGKLYKSDGKEWIEVK